MLLKIYSIFDSAVKTWRVPMYSRSVREMKFQFEGAVNDDKTDFGKYPSDFTLFELGEFSDEDASFRLHSTPIRVCVGVELVKARSGITDIQRLDAVDAAQG